jgi:hypothetical protein
MVDLPPAVASFFSYAHAVATGSSIVASGCEE